MANKKELIKAAKEIVHVMELEDDGEPIVVSNDMSEEDVTKVIKEAIIMIDPEIDEFTKATQEVIDELSYPPKQEETEDEEEEEEDENVVAERIHQENVGKKKITVVEPIDEEEEEDDEDKEDEDEPRTPSGRKQVPIPVKKKKAPSSAKKTEFGHLIESQAGDIDGLIVSAKAPMSIEEMAKKLGFSVARVDSHVKHLQKDKGVEFKIVNDKYILK